MIVMPCPTSAGLFSARFWTSLINHSVFSGVAGTTDADDISDTYWDLVDYLMFKYYFPAGKSVPTTIPVVPGLAS